MTVADLMRLSVAMPILATLSVLVAALACERLYAYWVGESLPWGLWQRVRAQVDMGDVEGALSLCRASDGPVAQGLWRCLSQTKHDADTLLGAFQLYRSRLQLELGRRVGFFGTASFISPLIGLFGTVLGIMRAFRDLAAQGAGGPAVVAAGIAEALVTTAAGIGVAVVSAVFYNYFTLAARERVTTTDLWVLELSELLSRPRGLE